ncbi:MAG: hypothetical protein PHX21_11145 [bacterium]|nr:hypothetical protein [bacterium]
MAQYLGSPLGIIKGSIGNLTFCYRRGKTIVFLKPPGNKNTDAQHKNVAIAFYIIARIYNLLKPTFSKYWLTTRNKSLNKISIFMKGNLPTLYKSLPTKTAVCSRENWFNFSLLQLTSVPRLYEPQNKPYLISFANNELKIKWDTQVWRSGAPDDTAHILILYCKPVSTKQLANITDSLFIANDKQQFETKQVSVRNPEKFPLELTAFYFKTKRKIGEFTIPLDKTIDHNFLSALLFFSNASKYSMTSGIPLVSTDPTLPPNSLSCLSNPTNIPPCRNKLLKST